MTLQFRLFLWFLFGFGLSAFSLLSFAGDQHPFNPDYDPYAMCNSYVKEPGITWSGACRQVSNCPSSQDGGQCMVEVRHAYTSDSGGGGGDKQYLGLMLYCPDATPKWNGTACVKREPCEDRAGQYDNGGSPGPVQLPGPDGVYSGSAVNGKIPATICINECQADPRAGYNFSGGVNKDGKYILQGNPKYSGQSCGTSAPKYDNVPKTTPEYDCVKAGKGYGTANGVVVCTEPITPSEGKGNTTTSTKPNSDGTKTETTSNTSVTCAGDGSCTTTTTTTTTVINADGSKGATDTKTESTTKAGGGDGSGSGLDKSDPFCVENPSSPMCKQGKFGGSCDSGFTCEGDPAACASAKALQEQKCEQQKASEALSEHADESLAKFDQAKADAALNKDGSKDMKLNEIWESKRKAYLDFANGCPVAEKSFTFRGATYTFDLSIVCSIGEFVKVLMHLAAYMFALRLFQRTVF